MHATVIRLREAIIDEPLPRSPLLTAFLELTVHLSAAACNPRFVVLLGRTHHAFVQHVARLLAGADRERHQAQRLATGGARWRQQRACRTDEVVDRVEDRGRFDEDYAVVHHEHGNAPERAVLADAFEIRADRPVAVLEQQPETFH